MLQVIDVSKEIYQKQKIRNLLVIDNVSLSVASSEMIAIVGPSGCGKSTLIGVIGGLDAPTSGKIILDNVSLYSLDKRKRDTIRSQNIGIVFQNHNLVEDLNCYENIILPLIFTNKMKDVNRVKRVDSLIESLGLNEKKKLFPYQLSGGEQQRTAIARAMATQPKLLLADEPTGNLDQNNAHNIVDVLRNVASTYKTGIIIVTHDISVANRCHRTINMLDGRFMQ